MSDAPEEAIGAAGVGKVYLDGARRLEILKDVSFSVKKGEGVAILGPSGSGKTTLLNILSGLDRPTSGHVRLEGADIHALGDNERAAFRAARIGFVFQFYHLLSEFTALENVRLAALIGGNKKTRPDAEDRAKTLLETVGLGRRASHFPSELSGGEQQRVAIARALMNDPDILFCDEPTGNLDIETGRQIADLLKGLFSRRQKTVILVTHDERIAKMTDRVLKIEELGVTELSLFNGY
ncbi:MAG: ABC transporter ATP-binding protein [Candidatus Omnitrophica bacterium]|nr:ABC transporter ATP-binding protein [Candidatus Omnitrophota bacterium]